MPKERLRWFIRKGEFMKIVILLLGMVRISVSSNNLAITDFSTLGTTKAEAAIIRHTVETVLISNSDSKNSLIEY